MDKYIQIHIKHVIHHNTKCKQCLHSNASDHCFTPIPCQSFAANSWSMLLHTAAAGSEHSADFAKKTASKTNLQFDAVWSVCISFFGVGVWSIISFTVIYIYIYYMLYMSFYPSSDVCWNRWVLVDVQLCRTVARKTRALKLKSAGKLFPRIMLESLSKWRP